MYVIMPQQPQLSYYFFFFTFLYTIGKYTCMCYMCHTSISTTYLKSRLFPAKFVATVLFFFKGQIMFSKP